MNKFDIGDIVLDSRGGAYIYKVLGNRHAGNHLGKIKFFIKVQQTSNLIFKNSDPVIIMNDEFLRQFSLKRKVYFEKCKENLI